MVTPRLRPRLERRVPLPPEEVAARLEARLHEPDGPCRGLVTGRAVDLRIRAADRHFWSPELKVLIRPDGAGSALVGHFGPNANIWTMFLAAHGFVVLAAVTGLFYGLAQLTAGEPARALWSLPAAAVLVALIHAAAGVGQRIGHEQTAILEDFLDAALAAVPGVATPPAPPAGSPPAPA